MDIEYVEARMPAIREKLGNELFNQITIITEEQVKFLDNLLLQLENKVGKKKVRKKLSEQTGQKASIISLFVGEWNPQDKTILEAIDIAFFKESAENKNAS